MTADDDLDLPPFLRLAPEVRKAGWEANPPKAPPRFTPWREPEQIIERKKELRERAKIKRQIKAETATAQLEDKLAVRAGKVWNARIAKWEDPHNGEVEMTTAKKVKSKAAATEDVFGYREGSKYWRMMRHLQAKLGQSVPLKTLARAAYGDEYDEAKHLSRVVTMARLAQSEVIEKQRLPFSLQRKKDENNEVSYCLVAGAGSSKSG